MRTPDDVCPVCPMWVGWRRRLHALAWAWTLSMGALSCAQAPCDATERTSGPHRPVITRVDLLQPLAGDPWTLIFGVDFWDSQGDLGRGQALVYVGSNPPVRLALPAYFGPSRLPLDATSGRFALHMHLSSSMLQDKSQMDLATQLQDTGGHRSNCYVLTLGFDIQPIQAGFQAWQTWQTWQTRQYRQPQVDGWAWDGWAWVTRQIDGLLGQNLSA